MDIIAALHWVHDNAAEFGGDASNITLVGHDRGAAIANLLMISPMARGKMNLPSPSDMRKEVEQLKEDMRKEKSHSFAPSVLHPLFLRIYLPPVSSCSSHGLH